MLNRTDLKILEFCSMKYRYLSATDISSGSLLHITTVSQRLNSLYKSGYLKRKESGRGFAYRFNFSSENARKFRLFVDMNTISSLNLEKLDKFMERNRGNDNIITCLLYGSALKTRKFNDIDLLVVYRKEKIDEKGFDIFQMDVKEFRNLYSLGEPRLQSTLTTGRILIDRDFIFNYFENDLPTAVSEEILVELRKKYNSSVKSIEASERLKKEELKEKILEALEIKVVIEFAKNREAVPDKTVFLRELKRINPNLANLINKINKSGKQKELWNIFYNNVLK